MSPPKSLVLLSIFSVALGENQTVPRSGVPLITAGSDTHNRDYSKHIASIRLGKPKRLWGDNFKCGCTFIAPDVVLTAAHCIINDKTDLPIKPRYLTVVAGSVNRFHQTKDTVELKVRQVIVHSEYSVETGDHDIGILKLEKRATILFPNSAEILSINLSPVEPDTICTVMGWGWIFTGGIDSPILLYANVTVMSQFQCFRDHFEKSPSWGVICAGGEEDSPRHLDRDACNGDSGGPLVCNGMLAGIVSFGTHGECGKSGKPGGYTDVYYYRRWIKANSPESFPESSARSNVPAPIVVMCTMFLFKLSNEVLPNTF